jgi:hypothetical protein
MGFLGTTRRMVRGVGFHELVLLTEFATFRFLKSTNRYNPNGN